MVCIDCDRCGAFSHSANRPDFIILDARKARSESRWVVVEMKADADDAGKVVTQLQAGATTIEHSGHFSFAEAPTRLAPVVLKGGRLHTSDHQVFLGRPIAFAQRLWRIAVRDCGTPLTQI